MSQNLRRSVLIFSGSFFEDLSYAADGGLYAELIQNRSFEYNPADNRDWNSMTAWKYQTDGFGYGTISVETAAPVHPNNPHYILLDIQDEGQKGVGLENSGFDGIPVKADKNYNFFGFFKCAFRSVFTCKGRPG